MTFGCGPQLNPKSYVSDEERISLLQGIWLDDFSESPVFRIEGDTLFYIGESFNQFPFIIHNDSLLICGKDTNCYRISVLEDNYLELFQYDGQNLCLHKSDSAFSALMLHEMEVPQVSEVLEKDAIFFYNGHRYRGYSYINPTQIKFYRNAISDDGFEIENVFYDNIIHICVYEGKVRLYSKDINKQMFAEVVPQEFIDFALLSDMDFAGVDDNGFIYIATLCIPDDAQCYMIKLTIDKDKKLSLSLI